MMGREQKQAQAQEQQNDNFIRDAKNIAGQLDRMFPKAIKNDYAISNIQAAAKKFLNLKPSKLEGAELKRARKFVDTVVSELSCPIAYVLIINSSRTTAGHTYEKAEIQAWLLKQGTDPISRVNCRYSRNKENKRMRRVLTVFLPFLWRHRARFDLSSTEITDSAKVNRPHASTRRRIAVLFLGAGSYPAYLLNHTAGEAIWALAGLILLICVYEAAKLQCAHKRLFSEARKDGRFFTAAAATTATATTTTDSAPRSQSNAPPVTNI